MTDISEAFQFFDSQNARGKALEPYDLLKAFHLREMRLNKEEERFECVKKWENAVDTKQIDLVGKYLYRIRMWARNEKAYTFTKDNIEEFKGINLQVYHDYPYLKSYLLNDSLVDEINKNSLNKAIGHQIDFPFQITQQIINGKRFFEFVSYYIDMHKSLFGKSENDFYQFYKSHCLIDSKGTGDIKIKELFEATIILFVDKLA